MHISVLGELRVRCNGDTVAVPRGHAQRLLLALAVDHPREVVNEVLIERIWGDTPTSSAAFALRNNVARLRRLLSAEAIERTARGYRLHPAHISLDIVELERLLGEASAVADTDPTAALQLLDSARALRHGPSFSLVRDTWWARHRAAIADDRADAADDLWADLRLQVGPTADDIAEFSQLAQEHPEREARWTRLVRALSTAGRNVDALRVALDARIALAEHGVVPGTALIDAERAIASAPSPRLVWTPGARALEWTRTTPIAGRANLLQRLHSLRHITWIVGQRGQGKTRVAAELATRERAVGSVVLYAAAPRNDVDAALPIALQAEFMALGTAPVDITEDPAGAVLSMLQNLTRSGPVTVLIDDIDLLDLDALNMLSTLMNHTASDVRFVVTSRPTDDRNLQRWWTNIEQRYRPQPEPLNPLATDDIESLVVAIGDRAWQHDASARARHIAEVSEGNPAAAVGMVQQRAASTPRSNQPDLPYILHLLARLSPEALRLLHVLVVANEPLPLDLAVRAAGVSDLAVEACTALEREGFAATSNQGLAWLTSPWTNRELERVLDRSTMAATRTLLLSELRSDAGSTPLRARQLIEARRRGLVIGDELDIVVGAAIQHEVDCGNVADAAGLSHRYLDVVGFGHDSPTSTAAHLAAARALLRAGEATRAVGLLEFAHQQAITNDDPQLMADILITRSPLESGGLAAPAVIRLVDEALRRLPPGDSRATELHFIAAHHHANLGNRDGALQHIDAVTEDHPAAVSQATMFRGSVALLADGSPSTAQALLQQLQRQAAHSGIEEARINAAMLGLSMALVTGTVDTLRAAIEDLVELAPQVHRIDPEWYTQAARAQLALAVGDLDVAGGLIAYAETVGRDRQAGAYERIANVQRMLLMYQAGTFGMVAPVLAGPAAEPDALDAIIGTWGMACSVGGDVQGVSAAAERLAARPNSIPLAGSAWPLLAMTVAELAHGADNKVLARHVLDATEQWSGTGLSVTACAYVGTADMWLAMAHDVLGDRATAHRLWRSSIEQDHARGTITWARRVRRLLEG